MDRNKLDVSSESFDPLAAIYSVDDFDIPVPSAPVLDNVEVCIAKLTKPSSSRKTSEKKAKNNAPSTSAGTERHFTPDQMPIEGTKKELNNVLKFMKKQGDVKGPMSTLQTCIETGRRIKVIIRGMFSIIRLI